jgi:hypothetical protein
MAPQASMMPATCSAETTFIPRMLVRTGSHGPSSTSASPPSIEPWVVAGRAFG